MKSQAVYPTVSKYSDVLAVCPVFKLETPASLHCGEFAGESGSAKMGSKEEN